MLGEAVEGSVVGDKVGIPVDVGAIVGRIEGQMEEDGTLECELVGPLLCTTEGESDGVLLVLGKYDGLFDAIVDGINDG